MKIEIKIPFSLEKNLGAEYNRAFESLTDEDWLCIIDHDVTFLTPDAISIIYEYVRLFPDTGIFTCFTNRVSTLSKFQLLGGTVNDDSEMRRHVMLAENQRKYAYKATVIPRDISGFLMVISKKTWGQFKFKEGAGCLGLDTEYNRRIRAAGKKIMRMDAIYCWHTYRLLEGIFDKTHLAV